MVMIEIEKMMMIVKQNDNDVDKNNDVDVGPRSLRSIITVACW